jgi:hypothetical protein
MPLGSLNLSIKKNTTFKPFCGILNIETMLLNKRHSKGLQKIFTMELTPIIQLSKYLIINKSKCFAFLLLIQIIFNLRT